MKNKFIPILTVLSAMILTGCGGTNNSESSSSTPVVSTSEVTPTTSSSVASSGQNPSSSSENKSSSSSKKSSSSKEQEKFVVFVASCPKEIEYSLNKTQAYENEEVTLTITKCAAGYSVSAVQMNGKTISGANNVYKFNMPFGGASLVVLYSVSGDVTIQGEVSCALTPVSSGVYEGTLTATSANEYVGFDLFVNNNKQDYYSVYDPIHSFGNISWQFKSYSFAVASGSTYKLTYDTNKQCPFTIVRTQVDVLPDSADALYNLFDGDAGAGFRQDTCNPLDLKHITYDVSDFSNTENPIQLNYEYKAYADNSSLAIINDTYNEDTYYTYKKIDKANKTYKAVNTYPKVFGNNDEFLSDKGMYEPFAVSYDICNTIPLREGKWFDENKFEKAQDQVDKFYYNWNAHSGNALEWEIASAYRIDSTSAVINAASYTKYDVSSVKTDLGFTTTVKSVVEENRESTGSDVEEHCGRIFDITLNFSKNGSVTGMTYKFTNYGRDKWNFSKHEPSGTAGVTKKITYSAEYGTPYTGSSNFDTSKYFITKINDVSWNNPAVGSGNNAAFGDYVAIKDLEGATQPNLKTFDYLPKTALDAWQYDVVSDSEGLLSFTYGTPIAAGVGNTRVKITNHTKNSGVSFESEMTFNYAKSVQDFYIVDTDNTADSLIVYAGDTVTYHVTATTISGYHSMFAPVVYEVKPYIIKKVSDGFGGIKDEKVAADDLVTIHSHDEQLKFTISGDITEQMTIYFYLDSPYYGKADRTTTFTIYVKVNEKVQLVDTSWKTIPGYFVDKNNKPLEYDYLRVDFTNEAGNKPDYKKGTIYDVACNPTTGTPVSTDIYYFDYYVSPGYKIYADVTGCNLQTFTIKNFSACTWTLMFEVQKGNLGLALLLCEDTGSGETNDYAIFGDWEATYYDEEFETEYRCTLMESLQLMK